MSEINVDELIENHKKILRGAIKKCAKCGVDMDNKGIRMSMSINYSVHKCPKCGKEELVYKGPSK